MLILDANSNAKLTRVTFFRNQKLEFFHRENKVKIDTIIDKVGATTYIEVKLANPTLYKFRIYKERYISKIGKALGMQDIQIGNDDFDIAWIRSCRKGLIAIPRSVTITSINSPGPVIVVTSSTITGILSRNEGIGRIVHFDAKQFCQPPIPCNKRPSE